MAYRKRAKSRRTYRTARRAAPRRYAGRARTTRRGTGRRAYAGSGSRTVRIVVEQAPLSQIARPELAAAMNNMAAAQVKKAPPNSSKF